MQTRITWRTRHNGLTHRATLRDSEAEGYEIRTDCGLSGGSRPGEQVSEPIDITCPHCQQLDGSNDLSPARSENAPERPSHRDPPRERTTREPKSLAEILTEMGLPKRENHPSEPNTLFQDTNVIHRYTRADALRDGILIDVSTTAKEAGITYPTAVTSAVWSQFVQVPEGVVAQDEPGRLWDVIWLLRAAIRRSPGKTDTLYYYLHVRNDNHGSKRYLLKAVCGPDDGGTHPCLTVMLPEED